MRRNSVLFVLAFALLLVLMLTFFATTVQSWSNGGYNADLSNPDYGTHDWIAQHALDWLPAEEKQYILNNLATYLYGTELPDNGGAPDGIGDFGLHHIYYNTSEVLIDDAAAVRALTEYNDTQNFLKSKDYASAAKNAGIMSHYIADMAVFAHVMGTSTDWGKPVHHTNDYEPDVNVQTSSYSAEFNSFLSFDGSLTAISAYDAAKNLAYDTTFDVDGDLTCVWMDQNYNWDNSTFKNRAGESLNLAVNCLADVLHTLYLDAAWTVDDDGPADFHTIQEAINAADPGHTIFVRCGTYYEHVVVNKTVSLVGENQEATIIDGNATGTVVQITADNVNFANFTVRNAGSSWGPPPGVGYPDSCVSGSSVANVHLEKNNFTGAAVCVWLACSSFANLSNNMVFDATYAGMIGYTSPDVTIYRNLVSDCGLMGIHLDGGSERCQIADNTVMNTLEGMELEAGSAANRIEGNNLVNNNVSIVLNGCGSLNVFRRNNMTSSQYNIVLLGNNLYSFMQDMDISNIVNGKIPYYLTNLHDQVIVPSNYPNLGFLAVVNCTKVTLKDFDITDNGDGLVLAYSTNCTLTNITISENHGPLMYGGLTFYQSNNNTIINNEISNNTCAICLDHSEENIFHHNSFTHNDKQVVSDFLSPFSSSSSGHFSVNTWDNGSDGNYWSDYTGVDANKDGIGDTHYVIDTKNQDRYPLMNPWPFVKDTTPPSTSISLSGVLGNNDWFTSDVTVTLSATDNTEVDKTEYSLDNVTWTSYATPFSIAHEGNTIVYFKSTDKASNQEATKTKTIKIDKTIPSGSIADINQTVSLGSTVTFDASGFQDNIGIASYEWNFGDGSTGIGVTTTHTYTQAGKYYVTLTVKDAAGNTCTDTLTVTILAPAEAFPTWAIGIAALIVAIIAIGAILIIKRKT